MLRKVNMSVRAKHLYVYLDIKTESTSTNAKVSGILDSNSIGYAIAS